MLICYGSKFLKKNIHTQINFLKNNNLTKNHCIIFVYSNNSYNTNVQAVFNTISTVCTVLLLEIGDCKKVNWLAPSVVCSFAHILRVHNSGRLRWFGCTREISTKAQKVCKSIGQLAGREIKTNINICRIPKVKLGAKAGQWRNI